MKLKLPTQVQFTNMGASLNYVRLLEVGAGGRTESHVGGKGGGARQISRIFFLQ